MADPNLVNLAADSCWSSGDDNNIDAPNGCKDFDFHRNPLLCETTNLTESAACSQFYPGQMKYNRPFETTLTLEPRSSCGFFLNQYSAFLNITWNYPITLYHRDYKTVRYDDMDFLVKESDTGVDCTSP